MRSALLKALFPVGLLFTAAAIQAAEPPTFHLVIKDHRFDPDQITVPAGQRIKLIVENQQAIPSEFESFTLQREKVVTAHGKIVVFLSPLDPGKYTFFDDFHRQTQGTVIAK